MTESNTHQAGRTQTGSLQPSGSAIVRLQAKNLRIGEHFLNAAGDTVFRVVPDPMGKIAIQSVRGKWHRPGGAGFARLSPSRWVVKSGL